jgi:hypothetical protein
LSYVGHTLLDFLLQRLLERSCVKAQPIEGFEVVVAKFEKALCRVEVRANDQKACSVRIVRADLFELEQNLIRPIPLLIEADHQDSVGPVNLFGKGGQPDLSRPRIAFRNDRIMVEFTDRVQDQFMEFLIFGWPRRQVRANDCRPREVPLVKRGEFRLDEIRERFDALAVF